MGNIEPIFVGIFRFSLIAFVLLGTCLCFVRFMKQPLERIRLIQIGLLVLLMTLILGVADVVPAIDLALLPAVESSGATAVSAVDVGGTELQPLQVKGKHQWPRGPGPLGSRNECACRRRRIQARVRLRFHGRKWPGTCNSWMLSRRR